MCEELNVQGDHVFKIFFLFNVLAFFKIRVQISKHFKASNSDTKTTRSNIFGRLVQTFYTELRKPVEFSALRSFFG